MQILYGKCIVKGRKNANCTIIHNLMAVEQLLKIFSQLKFPSISDSG